MTLALFAKNFSVYFVRAGIWLLTAGILLISLVFGRLLYAPIDLDFARDTVIESAEKYLPGWEVSYATAQVGWDWTAVRPWLQVENVILTDRRDRLVAQVSEVHVAVSVQDIFSGPSIAELTVNGTHIEITDLAGFSDSTDDSLFDAFFIEGQVPRPEVLRPITEAFNRFTARLLANAPNLRAVTLNNASVAILRGKALKPLDFSMRHFSILHNEGQLALEAQVDALLANTPTPVHLSGVARPALGELAVNLGFTNLSVSSFAKLVLLPDVVSYLKVPLSLDVALNMSSAEGLRKADFTVALGEGVLVHPEYFPGAPSVNYGLVRASYNVDDAVLSLGAVELSLNGRKVEGSGKVFWQEGLEYPGVRLNLAVDRMSVADTKAFWPIRIEDGKERGARAWINQNMIKGFAKNVRMKVSFDPDGQTPFREKSLYEVTFDFEDIDTKYLKTMPPILGVRGRAVLTNSVFDVFVDKGTLEGMPIDGSTAHLFDINKRGKGIGEFDLKLAGSVSQVLKLISYPPVRIADRLKLDLSRLSGEAIITGGFRVPLNKDAAKGSTQYAITAQLQQAGMKHLLDGAGLTDGTIKLEVSNDDLLATGTGVLNGVPIGMSWRESFKAGRLDPVADTTSLVVTANVDEKDLLALGVNTQGFISGKFLAEATFLGRNFKFRVGYFSADAAGADMQVPQIGWQKPRGSTANVNGTVYFRDTGLTLSPLSIQGEDINLRAVMDWDPKSKGQFRANIDVAKLGRSQFHADIRSAKNGTLKTTITAAVFDAAPLLARTGGRGTTDAQRAAQSADQQKQQNQGPAVGGSVEVDLEAAELVLLNDERMVEANLALMFMDGEPQRLEFTGISPAGTTNVRFGIGAGGENAVSVISSDGGALLRGLGLFAHISKGDLTLEGTSRGWGPTLDMHAQMTLKNAALVTKESLGQHVTEGIISGVDSYLDKGSLQLDLVDFPFSYKDSLLDITDMKANGPTLGLTAEGQLETRLGQVNINGVVVPVYGLNSLLGKLPLIGGLFTGGSGKGLFGLTYRISGLTSEPKIETNPLSALAPGFLRLLFEGQKGTIADLDESLLKPADVATDPSSKPPLEKQQPEKQEPEKPAG